MIFLNKYAIGRIQVCSMGGFSIPEDGWYTSDVLI